MDEQQKDINAEQSSKTKQRKAYRSKSELSAEERTQLDRKEEIVQPLARKRLHKKRISNEEWEKVQEAFGCSLRHAHTHVKKYAQQMNHHPNQPELWGNSLIPNRGRPEGTFNIQTEKYRLSVRVGLTERTRTGVHHDGSKSKVDLEPGIDVLADVQEFAKSVIPDTPSEYTTRRVVRNLVENDPAYYKLATEGELALIRDAAPKLPFEVNEIDDIWAWDFCDLPNYVNNKGVISTAAMLVLIDYKSDKYLYVRVIPKKEIDPQGNILGTSFSKMDAASSAATAMYLLKRRPLFFYNDRDKRFNLADELERVTAPGQTPVGVHKALLEQPWSRGLQEGGFQRRLHRWATRYKGKYTKAKRRTIRKAIERPDLLPTPQLIAGDIKEFFENVNNEPRVWFRHRKGQAPSSTRNEVYNSFTAPRGCPSIQQLFHLPIVKHEDWVILDDEGFNFAQAGEDHFIPTVSSVEQLTDLTLRWMNAALSKGKIIFSQSSLILDG